MYSMYIEFLVTSVFPADCKASGDVAAPKRTVFLFFLGERLDC